MKVSIVKYNAGNIFSVINAVKRLGIEPLWTDNADELIAELVREYNKGRQQAITNELLDIVSGSAN